MLGVVLGLKHVLPLPVWSSSAYFTRMTIVSD